MLKSFHFPRQTNNNIGKGIINITSEWKGLTFCAFDLCSTKTTKKPRPVKHNTSRHKSKPCPAASKTGAAREK